MARFPLDAILAALPTVPAREVTVPAGCDPLDPAEIRSSVKRIARELGSEDLALLYPATAHEVFLTSLTSVTPPEIDGLVITLIPLRELLDATILGELFPNDSVDAMPPQDYVAKLLDATRRSPWYAIPQRGKAKNRPFLYRCDDGPKLTGPKLAVEFRSSLEFRSANPIARVTPSRIVLASQTPALVTA
jgi:hypothetical protein